MKKIFIMFLAIASIYSCGDITELNENPKGVVAVEPTYLVSNAMVSLMDHMTSTNVNVNTLRLWSQHWTQTTYTDESNFQLDQRDVNGTFYNILYAQVLKDLFEAKKLIEARSITPVYTETIKNNDLAIIELLSVYSYHVLVDLFGDIPYTEALSDGNVTPKYDDAATVYADLIARATTARNTLSGTSTLGNFDLFYSGNTAQWRKFANSLLLRMAVRLADTSNGTFTSIATDAISDGVFTSSADDASLTYLSSSPHTNPLYVDLVESGRNDFVIANTIGDVMNATNDPRRSLYARNLDDDGNITGGTFATNSSYAGSSQIADVLENPTYPASIISYTEVLFLLADAAQRGVSSAGNAEELYNMAITNSITVDWGGSADAASTFVDANAYDSDNWKESLGVQKWVAMYNRGFEAYSTYRVYNAPDMNVAPQPETVTPLRFTYPVDEYALNEANVKAAATKMNGDLPFTPIFWDAQ